MKLKSVLLAVVLFISCVAPSFAQNYESPNIPKFDFYDRAPYRENVPRPQSILRYDVGDFHTTYAQMENVVEKIAKAAPDRVRVFDIGTTNEYRMQHLVAISSPENIARLDEIRGNIAKLNDPRSVSLAEATQITQNTPIITWMAYTIHGNESASFETMMQVIYQLAASEEPATQEILKNCIVLVLTGGNPDGHERFATWYNSVAVGDANRAALEHREPWSIYGRLSHFRFDLNRDNVASTQKETQNMQKAFFEWNPQVLVDHHGQPSQYHFPPAALPINPNLPQPQTNKWLDVFGRANAAQFDARLWDYYVRDIFDLFYPGYWDSFPALNGATAMTYETDGGGFKGLRWTRDDGSIITFRSAIAKHYVASMTTLETAGKNRVARLQDYYEFKRTAIEEGKSEKMKRIIISPEKDAVKTAELIEVLRRAKIEVKVANASFRSSSAHSYDSKTSPAETREFPVGSYVIELAQPQKRLAKALLEQETPQTAEFVASEMTKFKRNQMRGRGQYKEDYGFYDITAWNLPMAFGVDAFWTEDAPQINGVFVTDQYLSTVKTGKINGGRASFAYVIPYETDSAAILAYRLMKEGFRVHVSSRVLNAGGKNWKEGTFVVRLTRNPASVHEAIVRLSKELGASITAINTGFNDEGDTGIGAENVQPLRLPKIAMYADDGADQTSYGWNWWTLDRYGIEFTPMTANNLRSSNLKNYNVVILPDGSPTRYAQVLNGLKDWINGGGTVICIKGAAVAATIKEVGLTTSKTVGSEEDDGKSEPVEDESVNSGANAANSNAAGTPKSKDKPKGDNPIPIPKTDKGDFISPVLPPLVSPSANAGKVPEGIAGAIFRGTIDRTTYLTFGLQNQETMPVLLSSGYFFRYSKEGTNAVIFQPKGKNPLTMSGFVWEGNTERLLANTAYIIDEPTGSGHTILFAEDPFFRGIFRSTSRIFFNSLIMTGSF